MISVLAPLAVFHMQQAPKLDHARAAVCIMGAVHFILRA
jgi:uncharacterized protein (DUF486 family)